MESRLHHAYGIIWTHSHVLQILQHSPHLPSFHESYLCRHVAGEMVKDLHGWSWNPYQGWHSPTPWTNLLGTPMPEKIQTIHQTLQMHVRHPSHGVSRHGHWARRDQDGWKEAGSHREMETPHLSQRDPVIHWICKLLQETHSRLLTLLPPLTYSLAKGNPGSGPNSNNELSNVSNTSSPLPPSYESLM